MFKKTKLLLMLLAALLLFSACVETPAEDIVVGKTKIDEEHVGELVETAGPSSTEDDSPLVKQELGAPSHLTESFETLIGDPDPNGLEQGRRLNCTVDIEADIEIPESGIFPVYSVEKGRLMDDALFERIVRTLFTTKDEEGETAYMGPLVPFNMDREGKNDLDPWIVSGASDHFNSAGRNIPRYLELMQGKSQYGEDYSFREFMMYRDGRNKELEANGWVGEGSTVIGAADYVFKAYSIPLIQTSYDEAKACADGFLNDIGVSGSFTLAFSGKLKMSTTSGDHEPKQLWGFAYVPVLNDAHMAAIDVDNIIDLTYAELKAQITGTDVSELWYPEMIRIYVDDEGIAYIKWQSCVESGIPGTVSRNAPLKPFGEILTIFKDKVGVQGNIPYIGDPTPESAKMDIDRIELSYYRVKSGNGADDYVLIPVWVFYGRTVLTYADPSAGGWVKDTDGTCILGGSGYAFMVINAMDGSIIDVYRGY